MYVIHMICNTEPFQKHYTCYHKILRILFLFTRLGRCLSKTMSAGMIRTQGLKRINYLFIRNRYPCILYTTLITIHEITETNIIFAPFQSVFRIHKHLSLLRKKTLHLRITKRQIQTKLEYY